MEKKEKKPRLSSIIIDGGKYMTNVTEKYKNRPAYEEINHNKIKAFIPGTIVEIMTKQGRKVEEGEVLLILEAMKMRNVVVSPINGRVKKLNVKLDQMVSKGYIMVEVE